MGLILPFIARMAHGQTFWHRERLCMASKCLVAVAACDVGLSLPHSPSDGLSLSSVGVFDRHIHTSPFHSWLSFCSSLMFFKNIGLNRKSWESLWHYIVWGRIIELEKQESVCYNVAYKHIQSNLNSNITSESCMRLQSLDNTSAIFEFLVPVAKQHLLQEKHETEMRNTR